MLILVVPFAFVQKINYNLYVLDILCLDNFYFAGVPQIILFSRTHTSLFPPAPELAHQELSRAAPCCVGSCGTPTGVQVSNRRFTWEPQSSLTLRENANEYWLVNFAYLSHSPCTRV